MGALDGKTALISGTGRGIGRAVALEFAAQGARVFGADLERDSSDQTVRLVREAGGEMEALAPVDLSGQPGADAWVDAAVEEFGGIDVLYNNASALRHGPIATIPLDDWYFTIQNELHLVFIARGLCGLSSLRLVAESLSTSDRSQGSAASSLPRWHRTERRRVE